MNYYRVYLMDSGGNFTGVHGFEAMNDDAARARAVLMSKGQDWSLWKDGKLIIENPSKRGRADPAQTVPVRSRAIHHRILLIDDNEAFLEPMAAGLTAEGHEVRSSAQGNDLIWLVQLMKPEILITDIIMQGVDVLNEIAVLHRSIAGLKIIAISGNPHLLSLASKSGADHVLAKPFRLEALNRLIQVAMQ